ncbi:MAG: choice-of-anchor B family protein [Saprospiraceae bacterium]|nr:choice-of-anchor B family protein [Saprospiraceae bacterium]
MKRLAALGAFLFLQIPTFFAQNLHINAQATLPFPGQTVANIWGYWANGREYALVGASQGMIVVDITDPAQPQQIVQIPGPNNLWKEIKTYGHYAYVTSEGGQGLQIVDLSKLPSPNLDYHFYTGDGEIAGLVWRIHALHVDEKKGFVYLYGGRKPNNNNYLFSGGAIALDLNADPYNPTYAGNFEQLTYVHDGYVDNDTLYAGHIYKGLFSIVNMRDKSNPELIASQNTPNNFTHNTWLSADRRTLFTTDETTNSYLAAYDISDPGNIRLLDKIQSNPGSGSAVHNTYILGNFAVTSWYKDGFTIVDATRPDNLVQVGNYDTYPGGAGSGFEGCWGVYPYFPSGTIIASVITAAGTNNGELWVMQPTYVRACYLEGHVRNGLNGNPINAAVVEVVGSQSLNSSADGSFKMGQESEGYYTVRVSKSGYQTREFTAYFQRGDVRLLDVSLYPTGGFTVSGQVLNGQTNQVVPNASVVLAGLNDTYSASTDAGGNFQIVNVPVGLYDVGAYAPGLGKAMLLQRKIAENKSYTLRLTPNGKLFNQQPTDQLIVSSPNPFLERTTLHYALPEIGYQWVAYDINGRRLFEGLLEETNGSLDIGQDWPPGVYVLSVFKAEQPGQTLKVIKSQ